MDAWRRVSIRNGFEEYDAPIFEYLDLFTIKSGDEIAGQLFSFEDRGGRKLAIRPEITPSLARMVNARINALPRPIKWFSVPRLCRAENPQKGRLREFFQWNIDVIGASDVLADAECIFTCVDFLREVGLTPADVQVRIGSRPLSAMALRAAGVGEELSQAALAVLDKRPKISQEEFGALAAKAGLSPQQTQAVCKFQDCTDLDQVASLLPGQDVTEAVSNLQTLMGHLKAMGVQQYCTLDLRIVRGLAYYTGIVYEVFDAAGTMRAIAGGGRYDKLLEVLGGPEVGATGFGMGDVVLGLLLEEKGKIPAEVRASGLDCFVIGEEPQAQTVLAVVAALRAKNISADFSYKRQALGKQLKTANQRGAKRAVIIQGDDQAVVKELSTGEQREVPVAQLLAGQVL